MQVDWHRGESRQMRNVTAGFFSFTEITDPSEHRSYNEWHQLDHLPEQYQLDGVVLGERWVASPKCRAQRLATSDLLEPTDYVTLYLMEEPLETTLSEFHALGRRLRDDGRYHRHRRSLLSGPFEVSARSRSLGVELTSELIPFRPNKGVYVTVEATPPTSVGERGSLLDKAGLLAVPGVVGIWSFDAVAEYSRWWNPGPRTITVCYLDRDVDETSSQIARKLSAVVASEGTTIEFAGPFEAITPWRWDWFDSRERR